MPVTYLRTMETELGDFASLARIITIWMMMFAIGSLAIAIVGQYAVVAFDMRRRTRDFGVRIASALRLKQIPAPSSARDCGGPGPAWRSDSG